MKPGRGRRAAAAVRAVIAAVVTVGEDIAVGALVGAEVTAVAGVAAADTETTIDPEVFVASRALMDRIETVLDEHVRPDLRTDGGDVVVVQLDQDNILQVRLTGACQGCSSSIWTLTMRVEATLKAMVPEIRFVEAVP
jgi:Fe-S cluster biogenesis protein NfuA